MSHKRATTIRVQRIKQITCHQCGSTVKLLEARPLSTIACPQCGNDVRVPAQVDHFLLVKQLAKGGSGVVYQAYDENLQRQVALKLIYKSLKHGEDRFDECMREARASAMLNHPNVVQVHSLSKDMGQPYIVMELMDGGSLSRLIKQGPLDEFQAIGIIHDAAEGLAAAHRLKIVHGDVKPQNILLDREGTAKLIDFGLAVRSKRDLQEGRSGGTRDYIAPEVARGRGADPRSDLYSLGATLFHALAAMPPFRGKTIIEVVREQLHDSAPDLSELRPQLDPRTAQIVSRMLALDPDDRYQTAAELSEELGGLRNLLGLASASDRASRQVRAR